MPKLTLLSRISDGLPLAASMEDEKDHRELDGYKAQAKKLLKTMNNGAPARVSVESGQSVFHYINQDGVCYMCLTEKSYPKRCATAARPALARSLSACHLSVDARCAGWRSTTSRSFSRSS